MHVIRIKGRPEGDLTTSQCQYELRCEECADFYSDLSHVSSAYECQYMCKIQLKTKEGKGLLEMNDISSLSPIGAHHQPICDSEIKISPHVRSNRLKYNKSKQILTLCKNSEENQSKKYHPYKCNVQINAHSLKTAPDITTSSSSSSPMMTTTTTTINLLHFISIIKSKFLILQTLRLLLVAIIPFCSAAEFTEQQLENFRRERSEAAQRWAPVVFLHPDEQYFPLDVHTFLHNVIPRKIPENERPKEPPAVLSMSRSLDIQDLPEGPEGEDTYLLAPIDPNCRNCPLPEFLHGTKPLGDEVPTTYAVITSCLPNMKLFASARNIEVTTTAPRRRMFRLGRKGRRLSLKERWNIFRRKSTPLPSYYDYHRDYIPLNSFTSSKEFSSLEEEGGKKNPAMKDYLIQDNEINGSERREVTVVTPPSTTLLPPRKVPSTTQAQQYRTTMQSQESTIKEIILEGRGLDTNTTEDTPNSLSSEEEILSNNLTTSSTTTISSSSTTNSVLENETKSPTEKQKPSPSTSPQEEETKGNGIEEDIKLNNTSHRFTVTYWMFYPYSQGKQLCTSKFWFVGRVFKPRLRNKCYGDLVTLNSHVGDWEHVSIYFEDNLPKRMYVSTHTHGAYYQYEENENIFIYKGKDTRIGLPLHPKYPPIIKVDGTHPVLYAALGSHGLWGSPGVHRYENFLPLEDKTVEGTPWNTWKNIDVIDYKDPDHLRMDRQWLQFHGKWGNPANGCYKALLGSCDLASGPTGIPLKRENFPCHLPDHPTFYPEI